MLRSGTIAFTGGVFAAVCLISQLPPLWWALCLVPGALLLRHGYLARLLFCVGAGTFYALLHLHQLHDNRIAPAWFGQAIEVSGRVSSLPERRNEANRFRFTLDSFISRRGGPIPVRAHVRLTWPSDNAPQLMAGEGWQLCVKLRPPRGWLNPGGFDYARWLFRHRIQATGRVIECPTQRRLPELDQPWSIHRLRQGLRQQIMDAAAGSGQLGVMLALAIGDRSYLDPDQWTLFRQTGTSHLVAISGLHIGLVAGLVFLLARRAWSGLGDLAVRWPAARAATVFALPAALVYAALAGFSVPTQRALIMLAVLFLARASGQPVAPSRVLAVALVLVLLLDPLAVLDQGFWLSFAAVSVIAWVFAGRHVRPGMITSMVLLQGMIALALAPLLVLLGAQAPLVAPFVNLLAVPLVSLLIIPLLLLAVTLLPLLPDAGRVMLTGTGWLLDILHAILAKAVAIVPGAWSGAHVPVAVLALVAVGIGLFCLPRGTPARWLGLVFLLPALIHSPAPPGPGEMTLDLLDVGQGLAAVVRTHRHVLVFDAGPGFASGLNAGDAVILPWLDTRNIDRIDLLMVSHGDLDHRGGTSALLDAIPVAGRLGSMSAQPDDWQAQGCRAGQQWEWDGIRFRVLHPAQGFPGGDNDGSCVLRIDAPGGSLLLTGDIEAGAEYRLLREHGNRLRSDILVVPHHGSDTSSTPGFVFAVAPAHALVPVAADNRYGLPDAIVLERYRRIGSQLQSTAQGGALHVRFTSEGVDPPTAYRSAMERHWHRWFGRDLGV